MLEVFGRRGEVVQSGQSRANPGPGSEWPILMMISYPHQAEHGRGTPKLSFRELIYTVALQIVGR